MKYKVYYKNDLVEILNSSNPCLLFNPSNPTPAQRHPVSTGGDFTLANGDILHINEQYGSLDAWSYDGDKGIGLTLESGHEFISYLIYTNSHGYGQQQSGYGVFYDLGGNEYNEGNVLKIYDIYPTDAYGVQKMFDRENAHVQYSVNCIAVLVIQGGQWGLTTDPRYVGQTVTVASGEEFYISGPSYEDGVGVYFTNSSGRANTTYYNRGSDNLAHSSSYWFSIIIPRNGDEIHVYMWPDGEDYTTAGEVEYYIESEVAAIVPLYCSFKLIDSMWTVSEDHSND